MPRDAKDDAAAGPDENIIVDSDLPAMDGLEPWEREAVTPIALELLADLHGQEDDDA